MRWVEHEVGPDGRVTSVRRLRGGDSSAVHALTAERTGLPVHLVLRRFVRADWVAREPDVARREAAALRLLVRSEVPAPRLIAVDEDGSAAGVPSVLMTRLPGRTVIAPTDMDSWMRQMAAMLPRIHAIRPTPAELAWRYQPYNDVAALRVPAWSTRPSDWQTALAVANGNRAAADEHLIHRDYHPANLLWLRGRLSGVVDWVNGCRGPAGVDIGHCRRNLALLHGVNVADRFLKYCLEWADYSPYWDIITLTDWLPNCGTYESWLDLGLDVSTAAVRTRADEYIASLVARL
jgi:aminoglycoside phosphotransferase (APT) family kinase protein